MKPIDPSHDDELTHELRVLFREQMREAPPAPRALTRTIRGDANTSRRRVTLWGAALAVAAAFVFALFVFDRKGVAADPRLALQQAARAYLELEDATLRIDARLQAIEILTALLSDEHEPQATQTNVAWVRIKAPNRMLLWSDVVDVDALATTVPNAGFDGTEFWSYDRATNVAERTTGGQDGASQFDWMRVLSFDFVRELVEQPGDYALTERTNATEKRAGLRTFVIDRKVADPEADDDPFWTEARVTIDGERGNVERIEGKFKLGPIALAEMTLEVVSTNDGIDAGAFAVTACVPKDALIREATVSEDGMRVSIGGVTFSHRVVESTAVGAERPDPQSDPTGYVEAITGMNFDVEQSKARRSMISTTTPYGFVVAAVRADSPAAAAGIEPGDIVLKWNGEPIVQVADLALWIDDGEESAEVKVEFSRLRKDVTLFSRRPWADFDATLRYAK